MISTPFGALIAYPLSHISKCVANYNEMEIHRTNAEKCSLRIVHQWRAVVDFSEKDAWEVLGYKEDKEDENYA